MTRSTKEQQKEGAIEAGKAYAGGMQLPDNRNAHKAFRSTHKRQATGKAVEGKDGRESEQTTLYARIIAILKTLHKHACMIAQAMEDQSRLERSLRLSKEQMRIVKRTVEEAHNEVKQRDVQCNGSNN